MCCAQNNEQGPGFRIGRTVINNQFLTTTAAKLAGSFTTVYAFLLSMGTPELAAQGGDALCALTEAQAATIRAAMLGGNASCAYNMTVAEVMAGL